MNWTFFKVTRPPRADNKMVAGPRSLLPVPPHNWVAAVGRELESWVGVTAAAGPTVATTSAVASAVASAVNSVETTVILMTDLPLLRT